MVRCLNHQAMTLAGLFLENENVKILLNFYIEEGMLDLLHAWIICLKFTSWNFIEI